MKVNAETKIKTNANISCDNILARSGEVSSPNFTFNISHVPFSFSSDIDIDGAIEKIKKKLKTLGKNERREICITRCFPSTNLSTVKIEEKIEIATSRRIISR
jgi:hypothetical protein